LFLDPDKLLEASPAEVLEAAARGHLGLDHRFLRALLDRRAEAMPAVVAFATRDRSNDVIDLAPELTALFRHWQAPENIPFHIGLIKEDPENVPDEITIALVEAGAPAPEPLLALYNELDEAESGEVAFILANLRVRDERILKILLDRMEFDLSDTLLLLGSYGDPAARPAIENAAVLVAGDVELMKESADTLELLGEPKDPPAQEPFDIWELYPEEDEPPLDLLDEDERGELLTHPVASMRAAAAHSFFNRQPEAQQRELLLKLAQEDESAEVRARSWEALIEATEEPGVVDAMLRALRNPEPAVEERGGLLVGMAPEADRAEVRKAIVDLYAIPNGRAKALEAMWRSVHPAFRDYFAKHLSDADLEIRRGAIWGVGYYGIRSELDKLRQLFDDQDLRSDALFAYALATPTDVSRSRMKGLFARIEKDAHGLSEMEEELVKAALDERLLLAGKEPVFRDQED
jgi:hypothetical protein